MGITGAALIAVFAFGPANGQDAAYQAAFKECGAKAQAAQPTNQNDTGTVDERRVRVYQSCMISKGLRP